MVNVVKGPACGEGLVCIDIPSALDLASYLDAVAREWVLLKDCDAIVWQAPSVKAK